MANFNFNKVTVGGRVANDIELKSTSNGIPTCSFSVAVNRRRTSDGEQKADFIRCRAWREKAETICRYFRKGSSICIVGALQQSNWTDSNGEKRFGYDVLVDEFFFVDGKNDSSSASGDSGEYEAQPKYSRPEPVQKTTETKEAETGGYENNGDDLPF